MVKKLTKHGNSLALAIDHQCQTVSVLGKLLHHALLRTSNVSPRPCARADFTTARHPGERSRGSEGSASGESLPVRAVLRAVRGQPPGCPETTALPPRSRRQEGPHRFPTRLPHEPPSRKVGHCPRRGTRPPAGSRRDAL